MYCTGLTRIRFQWIRPLLKKNTGSDPFKTLNYLHQSRSKSKALFLCKKIFQTFDFPREKKNSTEYFAIPDHIGGMGGGGVDPCDGNFN